MVESRPKLLFADENGNIYDHPYLEMAGCSGDFMALPESKTLTVMPEMSRLYFHPGCPPYGYDPEKECFVLLTETRVEGKTVQCNAVSSFIQQGWVRLLLPAMDYSRKEYKLPMWSYSAVGFYGEDYWVPSFEVDDNFRWDPDNFDDRTLVPLVQAMLSEFPENRLVKHLERCALEYHCFAAKNFFYKRWEAPMPTSPVCNCSCLGCISLQTDEGCKAAQDRINFVPSVEEITVPFAAHLNSAQDAIVSFGQGCEGEPIMQWKTISEAIARIRSETSKGTINLNTNASVPAWVDTICESGLDSIRISINSARKELYTRYYRPRGYCFEDVLESIRVARQHDVFTMINYLVFPGITDQPEELKAMIKLIEKTRPHLIHLKNLNIDPDFYIKEMNVPMEEGMGMDRVMEILQDKFPELQFGYYNRTRESFFPE